MKPFIDGTLGNYSRFVFFLTIKISHSRIGGKGEEKESYEKLAEYDGSFFILGI